MCTHTHISASSSMHRSIKASGHQPPIREVKNERIQTYASIHLSIRPKAAGAKCSDESALHSSDPLAHLSSDATPPPRSPYCGANLTPFLYLALLTSPPIDIQTGRHPS